MPALLDGVNGTLYGTTSRGERHLSRWYTVLKLDPGTGKFTLIHTFGKGKDGYGPTANLIDIEQTLYGTTAGGGGL